jgi:hypothetical protein
VSDDLNAIIAAEPYDEAEIIRTGRERMGRLYPSPGTDLPAQWLGVRLAEALRREFPDIDPVTIGRVVINAASKAGATLHVGLSPTMTLNVLADAGMRLLDGWFPAAPEGERGGEGPS